MLKACFYPNVFDFIMKNYLYVSCMWVFFYHLRSPSSTFTWLAISSMRAWPSSWFCVVSRLVIRFNVLFMFIHQWTHKIPLFSHSLNNKSSNTEIRISGSTRLEYKHRGKIEGKKKIQLLYSRSGRRHRHTRRNKGWKYKETQTTKRATSMELGN